MYTVQDINNQVAQKEFAKLIGKRPFIEGSTVQDIEDTLSKLELDLYVEGAPKVIFSINHVLDEKTGEVQKLSISVRPSSVYKLKGVDTNYTIVLDVNENIYTNFIMQYAKWLDNYFANYKLVENIAQVERDIKGIIAENAIELPINFSLELGYDIIDIEDSSVVLGITPEIALNLSRISLYDNVDLRRQAYRERVADFFKEVTSVQDFFRLDSQLIRDLGLKNRKSLYSMIRKRVTRKVDFLRTGEGYYESENTFAVVERVAIKEEEVAEYTEKGYLVHDNAKPTKREKEAGRVKIASRFKLSPIPKKEDGEVEQVQLDAVLTV